MRIAIVHSFYVSGTPSGENLAVLREAEALTGAGHDVKVIARNTDDLVTSKLYTLTSAVRVATGWGGDPSDELKKFNPDVTHVHNLFPNIGTAWLNQWEGPLVATLHNFRPLCANGILFRDGAACTECPDGSVLNSLKHSCYRDSKVATLPLTIANRGGLQRNRLLQRADKIIALSDRVKSIYEKYGLSDQRLALIPNGVDVAPPDIPGSPRSSNWVAVGRLTPEKGFGSLAREWPPELRRTLDIYGNGPELDLISNLAKTNIRVRGAIPNADVMTALPEYTGLILASKWFEGATPLTVLEALGSGLPVIAHDGNSAADFLMKHEPTWVYDGSRTSLVNALNSIESRGNEARTRARQLFDAEFSLAIWVKRLEALFSSVL